MRSSRGNPVWKDFLYCKTMKWTLTLALLLIDLLTFAQKVEFVSADGRSMSMEDILQEYIQIPSDSGSEKKAGDYLKSVCAANGLYIADFGSQDGNFNFAASLFPLDSRKPNIIFLNHIDVVPESRDSDTPYSGLIKDGSIYGRGAIDNKGAAVQQLYGMLLAAKKEDIGRSPYNITFLAVSCEETQCAGGISYVIENFFEDLIPVVVFGEGPTEITSLIDGEFRQPIFGISVAHKRAFWLELKLEFAANGHGSVTPLEYANKQMVASLHNLTRKKQKAVFTDVNTGFLKEMAEHRKGLEKFLLKHPRLFKPLLVPQLRKQPELFSIFSNTITLTDIHTNSEAFNKIASTATAHLDCRLLPETDEQEFLRKVKKRLKNDNIQISIVEALNRNVPSSTDNIYYHNLRDAILEKYPTATTMNLLMPNINDLGAFRTKGIPAYGNFPIYLDKEEAESIHGKNEHISIQELYNGADVYYILMKKMIYSK